MTTGSATIKAIGHELREMLPPVVFFGVGFNALVQTLQVMSEDSGTQPTSHLTASLGALLVAKAILIADLLPFLNRFRHRARIFEVIWKGGIYYISTALLHVLERLVSAARAEGTFASGLDKALQAFDWSHFAIVQMWLAILLFSFTALMLMVRDLGHESLFEAFFSEGPRRRN
ncbi:hypothetical protein [Ruegeria sp. PrR005]|uniref:Uncharacterized protein n=1 Tax=Ruegeria sp. PrR005 TaxID=2706882 RepID=A0A6B2NKH1_9RHOB|nr:hypothetical protein [Ruegeria sp. PrR005]NDW44612.1 hypothetical protein [Ruegeria sp. PrR005]